jgi:hypothetical protein
MSRKWQIISLLALAEFLGMSLWFSASAVTPALTMQTSLGFLLTLVSIRLIPILVDWIGWQRAFIILGFGPLFGIWAMFNLKRSPAASQLAGGRG